jgi:RNA polymerase sigma-70 factor (ECF subfamily)
MKENLEATYMKERNRILHWMESRIGVEDAEDALHDVIVRTLVNLDAFEGVRDLSSWLWQGARNAVIDRWRKRGRRKLSDDEFDDFIDTMLESAVNRLEREELLSALARAIESLPEEQRDVIVAQGLSGETFQSISERTGVKIETLAARKRYALAKLRDSLRSNENYTEAIL